MRELNRLLFEERDGVATVTLNRPEAGNRIDVQVLLELVQVTQYLEDESSARIVVLRGAGESFTEGIDFAAFSPDKPPDIHGFAKWEKAILALERQSKLTIAAMDGRVLGGGFQLSLACDIRLATARVEMGLPEVRMGFLPGMSTFRLAKYVGLGRAKDLILSGRSLGPVEARSLGLVDRVCEPEELEANLAATVEEFLPVNPVSVSLARRLLNESFAYDYEDAIGHFLAAQHRTISTPEFLALVEKAHGEGGR